MCMQMWVCVRVRVRVRIRLRVWSVSVSVLVSVHAYLYVYVYVYVNVYVYVHVCMFVCDVVGGVCRVLLCALCVVCCVCAWALSCTRCSSEKATCETLSPSFLQPSIQNTVYLRCFQVRRTLHDVTENCETVTKTRPVQERQPAKTEWTSARRQKPEA